MTDKRASELAREAFKLDRGRAALLEKTYKKMGKELVESECVPCPMPRQTV